MKNMTSITVKISDDEKKNIANYAEEQDLTMSQVVRRALKYFFEQNEIVSNPEE